MANTISYGIFFDGTGNNKDEGEETKSNVARLYELFKEGESSHKLYIKGLGTSSVGDIDFGDGGAVTKTFGAGFGYGGQRRIDYALKVLKEFSESIDSEDKIELDLFGFSRGAALARHFTNVIQDLQNISIRFLGLYDTVGSFGLPGNETNLSLDLSVNGEKNSKSVSHHFQSRN